MLENAKVVPFPAKCETHQEAPPQHADSPEDAPQCGRQVWQSYRLGGLGSSIPDDSSEQR